MPAGTFTVLRLLTRTLPRPWHFWQGSVMILPLPRHLEQVRTFWMRPKGVFCTTRSWPVPLQVEQVSTLLPGFAPLPWHSGHSSSRTRLISFSQPKAASSRVMVRS